MHDASSSSAPLDAGPPTLGRDVVAGLLVHLTERDKGPVLAISNAPARVTRIVRQRLLVARENHLSMVDRDSEQVLRGDARSHGKPLEIQDLLRGSRRASSSSTSRVCAFALGVSESAA